MSSRGELTAPEVIEETAIDDVGEAALHAAHGLGGGLAGVDLAAVLGLAGSGRADLGQGDHVQRLVQLPVAGAGEPVADDAAAGGLDRRDAAVDAKCALVENRRTSPT